MYMCGDHFEFGHNTITPGMTKWHHLDSDSRHAEVHKQQYLSTLFVHLCSTIYEA